MKCLGQPSDVGRDSGPAPGNTFFFPSLGWEKFYFSLVWSGKDFIFLFGVGKILVSLLFGVGNIFLKFWD